MNHIHPDIKPLPPWASRFLDNLFFKKDRQAKWQAQIKAEMSAFENDLDHNAGDALTCVLPTSLFVDGRCEND
jgi:hypothetical protein